MSLPVPSDLPYEPRAKSFLISEACGRRRSACAIATAARSWKHHAQADLAPRDVVARAIDYEMKRTGETASGST